MKYKLIKKYPGIYQYLKIGCIATLSDDKKLYNVDNLYSSEWTEEYFSQYPEFWEPIVEKEYEILSFYKKHNNYTTYYDLDLLRKNKEYCYNLRVHGTSPFGNACEQMLIGSNYAIHSVKRLSDGEVFTIGDKIQHKNDVAFPNGILTKISIMSDTLFFESNNRVKGFNTNMCYIQKAKQPLFTTEDGFDIFESDNIFYIETDTDDAYTVFERIVRKGDIYKDRGFVIFSTKESAEDYIFRNKPCLSYNDVLTCISNHLHISSSAYSKIEKLTKTKLKK